MSDEQPDLLTEVSGNSDLKPAAASQEPAPSDEPKPDDKPADQGEPSAFESMSFKDIEALSDEERVGFESWAASLPADRKSKHPLMHQASADVARRSEADQRDSEARLTKERVSALEGDADRSLADIEAVLTTEGNKFFEAVKAKVGDEFDLDAVPFNISRDALMEKVEAYAAARVPVLAHGALKAIGEQIQDTIEALGTLTEEDATRLLGEREKTGKPHTWAYLQEIVRRSHDVGRKEADAEWEAKMPGERAAIRTLLEKEMNIEPEHGEAGGKGGGGRIDFSTIKGIHEARRNGKLTDTEAREKIGAFT